MNDYDKLRTPTYVSSDIQYVCVTDDTNITDSVWDIKYVPKDWKRPIEKFKYVKFHPFEFVDGDFCVYVDSTIEIDEATVELIRLVEKQPNYQISFSFHPNRFSVAREIRQWIYRGELKGDMYDTIMDYCKANNFKEIGLFFCCLIMYRKTTTVIKFGSEVYKLLEHFENDGDICRSDQILIPFIVWKFDKEGTLTRDEILPLHPSLFNGRITRRSRKDDRRTTFNVIPNYQYFDTIVSGLNEGIIKIIKSTYDQIG